MAKTETLEKTEPKFGGKLEAETLFQSPYYPDSFIFPYNPDPLVSGNDYSVYDEMRDDDQVKVALALKKSAVVGPGWTVACKDTEVSEIIRQNLENVGLGQGLESSWDEVLFDILNAYDYGFTLSEPLFKNPGQSGSGRWELKTIKVRPPHSFIFHLDPDGTVREVEQAAYRASSPGSSIKLSPSGFIHFVNDPEFGNPYGKADLRAAHPAWKAKKFIFRMAMRYAERFAGPTVIGRYTPSMGTGEVDRLYTVLRRLQDNSTLVIPKEAEVELIESSKNSSSIYEAILDMLNLWVARAILVPDLMGVSGSKTDGGSQALGREHYKIFEQMVEKDRKILARKINLKLVQPLVKANFGQVDCKFEFKPYDTGEGKELLKLWVEAVNGKAFKPNEEEVNYFRKSIGFPEGTVEVPEPQSQPQPLPPLGGQPEREAPGVKPEEMARARQGVLIFRDKTSYEAKVDFARIEEVLDRSETGLVSELMVLLRRMVNDLVDQVRAKRIVEKFRPGEVNKLEPHFRKEMNEAMRGHFISLFRVGVKEARDEIVPRSAQQFTADDIFPDDFEDIIKAESFKLVGDITSRILKKTQSEIISGIKDGAPLGKIVAAIKAAAVDAEEQYIITTVRTRTTEVYNAARKTFFDSDPVAQEIIVGYQYSAIMDTRTSEVCRALDGQLWDKDTSSEFLARVTPPLHFNCRSTLVPITKFEEVGRWDKPKSFEWLERRGAGLIQAFQFLPNLIASGEVTSACDHQVVMPPGEGRRILVRRIYVYLKTDQEQAMVGFRVSDQDDVKFQKSLMHGDGEHTPDLGQPGWLLPENTGLLLNSSSNAKLSYTCDYEIQDLVGNRLA